MQPVAYLEVFMNIINAQRMFGETLILANRIQLFGDNLFQDFTLKQWFLLVTIHNIPDGNVNVTEIAKLSGTSRQNIRKMLTILSSKGYVNLHASEDDGRALTVSLTPKAHNYLNENEANGVRLTKLLFNGVNDQDIKVMNNVYEIMFRNLKEMENNNEKI